MLNADQLVAVPENTLESSLETIPSCGVNLYPDLVGTYGAIGCPTYVYRISDKDGTRFGRVGLIVTDEMDALQEIGHLHIEGVGDITTMTLALQDFLDYARREWIQTPLIVVFPSQQTEKIQIVEALGGMRSGEFVKEEQRFTRYHLV